MKLTLLPYRPTLKAMTATPTQIWAANQKATHQAEARYAAKRSRSSRRKLRLLESLLSPSVATAASALSAFPLSAMAANLVLLCSSLNSRQTNVPLRQQQKPRRRSPSLHFLNRYFGGRNRKTLFCAEEPCSPPYAIHKGVANRLVGGEIAGSRCPNHRKAQNTDFGVF